MATSSSIKRENNMKTDPQSKQRQKRFKVGRACYSCRVKKIKCDGIQPCMQCKARHRQCTFSLDGSMDNDDILANESSSATNNQNTSTNNDKKQDKEQSNPIDKLDKHNNSNNNHINNNNNDDQQLNNHHHHHQVWKQNLDNTTKILTYLSNIRPGEGKEGRWYINDHQLLESSIGSLPLIPTPSVHLPPRKQQKKLIQLYYQHHYPLFPLIPQDYFMEQYEKNRPFVTPFLLLVIFAHGSLYDEKEKEGNGNHHEQQSNNNNNNNNINNKSNHYMKLAQGLLDTILNNNIPSISTVVGLCLMSLYEPKQGKDYRLKSASYSSIAFRMCNHLGLGQIQPCTDEIQVELRLRVAWSCYCLDKMQSIYLGDPWMLRLQDMTVNLPQKKWPNEDGDHLDYFVTFIKLMQMAERILNAEHLFTAYQSTRFQQDDSQTHQLEQELIQWIQLIPNHLKWSSIINHHHLNHSTTTTNMMMMIPMTTTILSEPPKHAYIAHLYLLYYLIRQHLLIPYASSVSTSSESESESSRMTATLNNNHHHHQLFLHQNCVTVATQITILTSLFIEQRFSILSYTLFGSSIILATRIHLLNCSSNSDDQNETYVQHARSMFQKCMQSLLTLTKGQERLIPGIDAFVVQVEQALQSSDTQIINNNNNHNNNHINHINHNHNHIPIQASSSASASIAINAFDLIHNDSTPSTPHSLINGSEQSAEELLSQAFNTLPTTTPSSLSSSPTSTTISSVNNNNHHHPSSLWTTTTTTTTTTTQQQNETPHHLDFWANTNINTNANDNNNNVWTDRMIPSSVDTLLYKSRYITEDKRYQDLIGGGLLMSHAKLNDPLLTAWMLKYAKELGNDPTTVMNENDPNNNKTSSKHLSTSLSSITPTSTLPMNSSSYLAIDHGNNNNNSNNNHSIWSTSSTIASSSSPSNLTTAPIISSSPSTILNQHHPTITTTTTPSSSSSTTTATTTTAAPPPPPPPIRSFGQYMNIGLGVYASAHQHRNDVIRQHIPDINDSSNHNSRSVILTHQGQVIVTPSNTDNILH